MSNKSAGGHNSTKDPRGSWRVGKLYKRATNRFIRHEGKKVKVGDDR